MTDAASLMQRAVARHRQRAFADAEALYREVLAGDAQHYDALHLLGVALHQQGRHADAAASIERALDVRADDPASHTNLALALRDLGRLDEALASLDRALVLRPAFVQALNNRGNVLRALGRPHDALSSYDRALAVEPRHAGALRNRADVLLDVNRPELALASLEQAVTLAADDAVAWNLRGIALGELGRHAEAIASYERALSIAPDLAEAAFNRGSALLDLRRYGDAAAAFASLEQRAPSHPFVRGQRLHAQMLACDWRGLDALVDRVNADVRAGHPSAEPFGYQAVATSIDDLRRCAEVYARARFPEAPAAWRGERYRHARIRIGYVSGEFREQATSILMAELFERHDRSRFEPFAFDNGSADDSPLRRRIERAFGGMVAIAGVDDDQAAMLVREREVDVLVNLNGYFGRLRQGLFARRPAPVQVNWLGFPGTLGAQYIDYIIADAHVIPAGDERGYVERVVRLPDSYQPNDSQRQIAPTPARAQAGLPDDAFVFCCFNNNYKIVPAVFDVWMRLLRAVPGSVLWLFGDNADAIGNLRREASNRGVDAGRLVFAPRAPPAEHLARHRLADLFVDTLPYNAHTTASDALFAGLPLVTVTGPTFPGRVATSLLHAVGLPELVTGSLPEYEALALTLARSPERLAALRSRLSDARERGPLFDGARFCAYVERAYETMVERQRNGLAPASFDVPVHDLHEERG